MSVKCFDEEKVTRLKNAVEPLDFSEATKLYKALGNVKRQRVLHILKEEACCVCDLANILECPVPNISQYLKILGEVELVKAESQGKFLIYSLTDKAQNILSSSQ